MVIVWKCSALLIPQAREMEASDRVDDRKTSPAPTPDYSLKLLVNLPESHLLHLDMSCYGPRRMPVMLKSRATTATVMIKVTAHQLPSSRCRPGPGLGALWTAVVPVPQLGSQNKNMPGSQPTAIKWDFFSSLIPRALFIKPELSL